MIFAPIAESTIPPGLMWVTEIKSVFEGSLGFGRMMLDATRISARTYFFPRLREGVGMPRARVDGKPCIRGWVFLSSCNTIR